MLAERIVHLSLSKANKYFLYSAKINKSIFNFVSGRLKKKSINGQEPLNDIWDIININKQKKESLLNLQKSLIEFDGKVKCAIKKLFEAKDEVLNIASNISSFTESSLLSVFQYKKILEIFNWINMVFV